MAKGIGRYPLASAAVHERGVTKPPERRAGIEAAAEPPFRHGSGRIEGGAEINRPPSRWLCCEHARWASCATTACHSYPRARRAHLRPKEEGVATARASSPTCSSRARDSSSTEASTLLLSRSGKSGQRENNRVGCTAQTVPKGLKGPCNTADNPIRTLLGSTAKAVIIPSIEPHRVF